MKRRFFLILVLVWVFGFGFAAWAPSAVAQGSLDYGLTEAAVEAELIPKGTQSRQSPEEVVGLLIQSVLGLTGLAAFVLVVYAGTMYLLARDNEEQVKKAKTVLKNAVMGLIILFASYAITSFIVGQLSSRTLQ